MTKFENLRRANGGHPSTAPKPKKLSDLRTSDAVVRQLFFGGFHTGTPPSCIGGAPFFTRDQDPDEGFPRRIFIHAQDPSIRGEVGLQVDFDVNGFVKFWSVIVLHNGWSHRLTDEQLELDFDLSLLTVFLKAFYLDEEEAS